MHYVSNINIFIHLLTVIFQIKILKKQQLYRAVFIFIANILPTLMACSIFVVYSSTSPVDPETGKRQPLTTPLALLLVTINC